MKKGHLYKAIGIVAAATILCFFYYRWQSGDSKRGQASSHHASAAEEGAVQANKPTKTLRLKTKLKREELDQLSPEEHERLVGAINDLGDYMRDLEFKHAVLKFDTTREDRTVRLYELNPPTPEELNDANRRVREIIASSNLTGAAKVLFARTSMDIIDEMTVEANKKGSLFFNIPLDETRDIFIDRSRDHKSIDALAKELKESNGMDAQSLGSGAGEIRMISRTKEGWRYEKFLMLEEQNK